MSNEFTEEKPKYKKLRSSLIIEKHQVKKKVRWTQEEDKKLINIVEIQTSKIVWGDIAKLFENKSNTQCYLRYRQINPSLNKGLWSEKEERLLIENIKKYGKNWAKLAVILKTRSGKQIRDHYNYCLDNKSQFTEDEDDKIKKLYLEYGTQFSKFCKFLPGRTGESIKNRFHNSIKKTIKPVNKPILFRNSKF